MPLHVWWEIGKKRRGNWRVPLEFHIECVEGHELELRPHLKIKKRYPLPSTIILGKGGEVEERQGDFCREIKTIAVEFDDYITKPFQMNTVDSLGVERIHSRCLLKNKLCRAYLPWRPGTPDYSDYEEVFKQVAIDLCETWHKAVAEAAFSPEYEKCRVVITSDNLAHLEIAKRDSSKQTVRKVVII